MYRNLIDNAIAHAPSNQPILVSAGPGPVISVRDHGPGIPLEYRAQIFEQFWQGGTRSEGGAGLGLGIVKRLSEAHSADIQVAFPDDGGTEFSIRFRAP